jgi:hypothetical protein
MRDQGTSIRMGRHRKSFLSLVIGIPLAALLFSLGCAGVSSHPSPSQTPVVITEVKTVAGKWEGLLKRVPPARQDDWVEVTIQETGPDTGVGEFASYRTAGVFTGKRPLKLSDGRITSEGERGSATFTLYESSGGQELRLHADMKDGLKYDAALSRSTK